MYPWGLKSLHSSLLPENVQATPLVTWLVPHSAAAAPPSSQDLNINLPLSLSPRSAAASGMQSPYAGCREEEEEEEEEGFVFPPWLHAA